MTRDGDVAVVMVDDDELQENPRPLKHLRHKSKILDWTRGTGPGAGHAPSDLARSIVGDLLEVGEPAPGVYREVTLQLARIPAEGGELTEDEILELIDEELLS